MERAEEKEGGLRRNKKERRCGRIMEEKDSKNILEKRMRKREKVKKRWEKLKKRVRKTVGRMEKEMMRNEKGWWWDRELKS